MAKQGWLLKVDDVIQKLTSIELDNPFPYGDTDKIQLVFELTL
jgi:hypothetical protein